MKGQTTKKRQPLVSVIIPTYNREKFLVYSIDSVLEQTYNNWELIIVDDGSTDNTTMLVLKYINKDKRVKYIKNTHIKGDCGARSQGIEISKGDYIAFLDSDDLWIDTFKLQKQVDFLESHPDYDMVYSDISMIDENNKIIDYTDSYNIIKRLYRSGNIFFDLLKNNFINTITVCFSKKILISEKIKLDKYWFIIDYWVWLKIAMKSKVHFLNEKTTAYRIHNIALSRQQDFHSKRTPLVLLDILQEYFKKKAPQLSPGEKEILFDKIYILLKNNQINIRSKFLLTKLSFRQFPSFKYLLSRIMKKIRSAWNLR